MPLETGNPPDDLVEANPLAADNTNEGDDHLRLIKTVIKNWGGTWGGDQVDTLAKTYADAGDAVVQGNVDTNTAAIALKLDADGGDATNFTIDGATPLTDANYATETLAIIQADAISLPADNGKFITASDAIGITGTPVVGNRVDIFAVAGSVAITGTTFNGFGSSGTTLTIPGGYGASLIWSGGSSCYVIGAGSIA